MERMSSCSTVDSRRHCADLQRLFAGDADVIRRTTGLIAPWCDIDPDRGSSQLEHEDRRERYDVASE